MPLPHDDLPVDEASIDAFTRKPWGAWFDDEDGCKDVDRDLPANQTDDDTTDE